MPLKEADRLLAQLNRVKRIADESAAKELSRAKRLEAKAIAKEKRRARIARLFRRERVKIPFTARKPDRRGDLTVAALGVTLGLICALFPWYIFYNPEKFGVRAMKFSGSGNGEQTAPITLEAQPERIGAPSTSEIPPMKLDLFATGTARNEGGKSPEIAAAELANQPFPAEIPSFQLLHIENGRAMIADDAGIFIVQPGSVLPDRSRVEAIEERGGALVLITSDERVIGVSK